MAKNIKITSHIAKREFKAGQSNIDYAASWTLEVSLSGEFFRITYDAGWNTTETPITPTQAEELFPGAKAFLANRREKFMKDNQFKAGEKVCIYRLVRLDGDEDELLTESFLASELKWGWCGVGIYNNKETWESPATIDRLLVRQPDGTAQFYSPDQLAELQFGPQAT